MRTLLAKGYYAATGRGDIITMRDQMDALFVEPRDRIEAFSRQRLATLVGTAARNVPYYRDIIGDREITDGNVTEVLSGMPILTKSTIRSEGDRLKSSNPGRKVRWNTSGGSTGKPVQLLQDQAMSRESRAFELLFMKWAGHQMGEPHVLIWGVPTETLQGKVSPHERLFRLVQNETYLNCYRITDDILDAWTDRINRIRPTLIEAYVDAVYELSKRLLAMQSKIHRPRGIITSAGVLTPQIRSDIEKAFGSPTIINRYGSREVSNVACSCGKSDSLHVNEAMAWLEIVDDSGKSCAPGVEGNVIVSLFSNHTMPLIRYRIEDRATWDAGTVCACGRNTRKLLSVSGRRNDYLVGRGGVKVNGIALTTLLYPVKGIRQYQFRQSTAERVVLAIVPAVHATPEEVRAQCADLAGQLQRLLNGTPVVLEFLNEIDPSNSGKYRYVLNEIPVGQ